MYTMLDIKKLSEEKACDLCYLIGAFMGDGCIYIRNNNYQFSITSSDIDFCQICSKICEKLFNKSGNIKTINNKRNEYSYSQLVCCSKNICHLIKDLTCNKTTVPKIVQNDTLTKRGFIQGVMDADGWISKVSASDGYIRYRIGFKNTAYWTKQINDIIKSLEVRVGIVNKSESHRYYKKNKDSFVFSINTEDYCKKIGFRIARKQKLVEDFLKQCD